MRLGFIGRTFACILLYAAIGATPGIAAKGDITLLGQLLPAGMDEICDIWGYVDPNGVEYAIMGDWGRHAGGGVYIINVSDPTNPFLAKAITGVGLSGFDVKVWNHYIYACNGSGSGTTSRVFDISDIQNPVTSAAFGGAHNFDIHPDGYLYAEVPGLKAYDIATDPMNPAQVWFTDIVDGHDAWAVGNRLYDFHGYSGTNIYDITNRTSPQLLGSITGGTITYHHSGCPTPDGKYLYLCDELALNPTQDFTIWNIANPATPGYAGGYGDPTATVHNLYIIGGFAFVSYYSAGFRVFDVLEPDEPRTARHVRHQPVDG